jgi:ribonuclease T1
MRRSFNWLGFLAVVLLLTAGGAAARDPLLPGAGIVTVAQLPAEARETLALIRRGGPFPYRKDGVTFQNREQQLPARRRGYYKEYTVPTPGARDRGARRIIAGKGATGHVADSGEYYYTGDHYRTFLRIQP